MAYTKLAPRHTSGASVEELSPGSAYRLSIPAGSADNYRLAQLDDYAKTSRSRFPLNARLSLSLNARASNRSIPGTWGFGLWNDPFGLSLGFGGNPFRLPTLPNAAWFFGASAESYLSFKDPRVERNEVETKRALPPTSPSQSLNSNDKRASSPNGATNAPFSAQRELAANGFLAQSFCSPKFHPSLILAGLALPFSRKMTRRLLGRVIHEDGIPLSMDVTQWHRYRLEWRENRVQFEVDNVQVFESPVSPNPPLGLVIWIDNQYAAFTPEGKIGFGVVKNPESVWLEIRDLEIDQYI